MPPSPHPPDRAWLTPPDLWRRLKPLARGARHSPTPHETLLWQALRDNRQHGAKFRRQHTVGPYIVDFYCRSAKLVIEVDGAVHRLTQKYDAARQRFLESLGLTVIRFTNHQVETDLQGVLAATLRLLPTPPSRHSPNTPTSRRHPTPAPRTLPS